MSNTAEQSGAYNHDTRFQGTDKQMDRMVRVLKVRRRARTNLLSGFVDISNFKYREVGQIDFFDLWEREQTRLTPFCLDDENRCVIFVHTPVETDLTQVHPFFYEAQRRHAEVLYAVPYDLLNQIADAACDPAADEDVIFLHSTGRCGSTLLCKLLGDLPGVQSVSEPDFFSQIVNLREHATDDRDAELARIIRSCTRLLYAHLIGRRPDCKKVVIKLRGVCISAADVFVAGLPAAKNMFLYRNALETVDSFIGAIYGVPLVRWAGKFGLDAKLLRLIAAVSPMKKNPQALAPLLKDPHYEKNTPEDLVAFLTVAWLSKMDRALNLTLSREGLFEALVRYEDLTAAPMPIVAQLSRALCLPAVDDLSRERMQVTLSKNSQEGTALASTGKTWMSPGQIQLMRKMLQLHNQIRDEKYRIPGTLSAREAVLEEGSSRWGRVIESAWPLSVDGEAPRASKVAG
ncbi:MAG: hypothetical protein SVU69_09230 [Pseudomonadota bacterium]|nr:hypothetical protein [Pseudomonadota bacterium]